MIQFRNLRLARGVKTLIEGASLQIHPGWKVGLTGANGCGKSSLFGLLRGELHQDAGDLEMPAAWVIAHVAQETPALPRPAIEYVLDGDAELRRVEAALTAAEAAHDGEEIGHLHGRLQEIGGYAARARAAALMDGLGFTVADLERPVADFSGGWRMRLNLAQALMCRSDLLLLDEPTNHLDLEMRHALTLALQDYEGGMVIVSHDRALLRATCDRFLLVDDGRLQPFDGDLDDYKTWLAQRRASDAAAAQCPDRAADKASRKAGREAAAADRQARLAARRPLQKELDQLDKKLGPWNAEKAQLDERLADPALYTGPDAGEVPKLLKRQAELSEKIDEAELRWLELHEALEAIPAD